MGEGGREREGRGKEEGRAKSTQTFMEESFFFCSCDNMKFANMCMYIII